MNIEVKIKQLIVKKGQNEVFSSPQYKQELNIMGDMGEYWRDVEAWRAKEKAEKGVDCPGCNKIQPKRIPTRLMPGQKCKVCGYRDGRGRK